MNVAALLHLALSGLLVLITGMPFLKTPLWWVRAGEFPRVQIACLLLALLLVLPWLTDYPLGLGWPVGLALAVCLAWQLWWILPYARLARVEVAGATHVDAPNRLRVLSANVLMTNPNKEALIAQIQQYQPDLFVTLESDERWEQALDTLGEQYPHQCKCPLDNLYGMHVYSRLALRDVHLEFLVEPDKPSMHMQVILASGQAVQMHFIHPAPPSPTENETSSERDAELIVVAQQLAQNKQPVVVAGDLNDVAWSRTTRLFRRISGMLDPRLGRGFFNTFHAGHRLIRYPLDHFFHSRHFSLVSIHRLASIGSDHFPLLIELQFETKSLQRQANEAHLEADAEDRELADELVEREDVTRSDVPTPGVS